MIKYIKIAIPSPNRINLPLDRLKAVVNNTRVQYSALAIITSLIIPIIIFFITPYIFANRTLPRIAIAGVSAAVMPQVQVEKQLEERTHAFLATPLILGTAERTWEVSKDSIGFTVDVKKSAEIAASYGKARDLKKRLSEQWQIICCGADLSPAITYDNQALAQKAAEINQSITIEPQSAKISYVDSQFVIGPSVLGRKVDTDRLLANINTSFKTLNSTPITVPVFEAAPALTEETAKQFIPTLEHYATQPLELTYEDKKIKLDIETLVGLLDYNNSVNGNITLSREKLAFFIKEFANSIDREPKDALFQFENGKVTNFAPSQDGRTIDREALVAVLESAIRDGSESRVITVPVKTTAAQVSTENGNTLGIKELIGHGESDYRGSPPDRAFNITLSANRINGTLIAPGQDYSFNNSVGEISASTGYKQALVILGNRTAMGDGGGVCQVSTTVFRAVLNAGLPVVARNPHSFRVGYYENDMGPGYDAAIYQPGLDFKFKNDTGNYILLQAAVDPATSKLSVDLYGVSDGRVATISKPTYYSTTPAPPDLYIDDPNLPKGIVKQQEKPVPGALVGFSWTVTRNGKTIISETFKTNYRPWQAVFLRGTKEGM